VVLQDLALFPWLTVLGNVGFGLRMTRLSKDDRVRRAQAALELVGLQDRAQDRIDQLSGGMRQRVALARTLVLSPKVLLLDEAFSALDAKTRQDLETELRAIQQERSLTTVLITHSIDEALLVSDRVIALNGSPGQIRGEIAISRASADPEQVRQYHDQLMSWIA
jgi:ABC-type nitrate/sulfonate/bicarbonate transport system ATPase subunit